MNPREATKKLLAEHSTVFKLPNIEAGVIVLEFEDVDTLSKAFTKQAAVKYHYNSVDGWTIYHNNHYQTVSDVKELDVYVRRFMAQVRIMKKNTYHYLSRKTKSMVADILEAVRKDPTVHLLPSQKAPRSLDGSLDPQHIIALQNGLLDWSVYPYILHPHTPNFYTLNTLPFKWEGEVDSDMWIQYLFDATGSDHEYFELLQMFAGYCFMTHDRSQQKFLLCYGESSTGKSVFTDVLANLLGRDNVSHVPLSRFNDAKYIVSTYGKLLNISEESEERLEQDIESRLKHYTGGTEYQFRKLYSEPFNAYPTAKELIVTNHRPTFKDTSNAIWRRLLMAPFEHVVPPEKIVRGLAEKIITTELPGVLKWALEGAKKLQKFGLFQATEKSQILLEDYRRESLPEMQFLEDNFIECDLEDSHLAIEVNVLRRCYERWCDNEGIGKKSQKRLGPTIKKMFPLGFRKRARKGERLTYCYFGITIYEESEFYQEFRNNNLFP